MTLVQPLCDGRGYRLDPENKDDSLELAIAALDNLYCDRELGDTAEAVASCLNALYELVSEEWVRQAESREEH